MFCAHTTPRISRPFEKRRFLKLRLFIFLGYLCVRVGLYSCVTAHMWSEAVLEVAFLSVIMGHNLGDRHYAAPSPALFKAQSCHTAQTDLELCFTSLSARVTGEWYPLSLRLNPESLL